MGGATGQERRFTAELDELAAELERLAATRPPDDFQVAALSAIAARIPFDASFWGIATVVDGLPRPFHVHMDRVSHQAILDYVAIREIDPVGAWVAANPGRTVHFDVRAPGPGVPSAVLDYDHRFGIEQILCTMVPEPGGEGSSFLSLYRSPGAPTFSEAERSAVEALVPRLVAAFAACRARTGLTA